MSLKTLGQARPAGAVTGTVYQVPAGKQAIANVIICNTDTGNDDQFILYSVPAAGSPAVGNAIFRGTISPEDSFCAFGIALAEGESIRMYSANGRMTCTVSGNES